MGSRVPWYSVTVQEPSRVRINNIDAANFLTDYTNQVYFANGALCDITDAATEPGVSVTLTLIQPCVDEAHFQGEFEMYCTSPLWLEAANKGMPLSKDKNEDIPEQYHGKYNFDDDDSYDSDNCRKSYPFQFCHFITLAIVLIGMFWVNLIICTAIGATSSKWANVFAWLFTGNIVYCVLCGGVIPLVISAMGLKNPAIVSLGGMIVMFVFSCSFGAPMAWFEGHQKALEGYLEPSKLKTLNCWRNPTESFSQTAHHFIVFEEPDWYVDYRVRDTQKISIIKEEDDEGNAKPGRYNFCVAPIRYKGSPYCPQDFYAACYRKTDVYSLLSCSDADATTCGWQYNSAGNILRTLNRNEEFFSDLSEEDEGKWRSAFNLAPRLFTNPASSIMGYYSGAGPNEIQDMADEKAEMRERVFIAGMVVYSFVVLVILSCSFAVQKNEYH